MRHVVSVTLSAFTLVSALSFFACSSQQETPQIRESTPPIVHWANAPALEPNQIPPGTGAPISLDSQNFVFVENHGGTHFFQVEGVFSENSYSELNLTLTHTDARLRVKERENKIDSEIDTIFSKLSQDSGAIPLKKYPQVGYFTFLLPYSEKLTHSLNQLQFQRELIFAPVVSTLNSTPLYPRAATKKPPKSSHIKESNQKPFESAPFSEIKNYSGLDRIGVAKFIRIASNDIGGNASIDGSRVKIGIADTGISYNHPSFFSRTQKKDNEFINRISYMRDFTREGRVYFNPKAQLTAKPAPDSDTDILVSAQVITTEPMPRLPSADNFTEIKDLRIKASFPLRAALLNRHSGIKMGILKESLFQSNYRNRITDLNVNKKRDDQIILFFVPRTTPSDLPVIYADFSGQNDFRNSPPLQNWNDVGDRVDIFSESVGFDIQNDELPIKNGKGKEPVISASLVGFDFGGHGSHVAGIAAGSKTLMNDSDNTLARGVAPEAELLVNRICGVSMGCNPNEGIIDLAVNAEAEVINLSIGALNPFNDGYGPQETLINRLTSQKNTLFVISAGNSGPGRQTVESPSVARLALSVGATATTSMIQTQLQQPALGSQYPERDFILFFSSRGPTASGGFKPNLTAPGTELSAQPLNTFSGQRGGLDTHWGTSMASPVVAGAYALLLDAIKKYNELHPDTPLTTDVQILRQTLISTARPFDVNQYNPETGERSLGQYTWIDEGTGMLDLPGAWKKLFEIRDNTPPPSVTHDDLPAFELDYEPILSMTNPEGIDYDGTKEGEKNVPAFGAGLYLAPHTLETLYSVGIQRRIPQRFAQLPQSADLNTQLLNTSEEFTLKTIYYGSDKKWIKAGTLNQLECWDSPEQNPRIIGTGTNVKTDNKGMGHLDFLDASTINICVNRRMIRQELEPGNHGALIFGYRTVGKKIAPIPSFVIPVFITVPHKALMNATAYEINTSIKSFGVQRHYVFIPEGTTTVKVTLEVPPIKLDPYGFPENGEKCSGVQLFLQDGKNNASPFKSESDSQARNCDSSGSPTHKAKDLRVTYFKLNPDSGVLWDLNVFGTEIYSHSQYKIRVDYQNSSSSIEKISGDPSSLSGKFQWKITETTRPLIPSPEQSVFEMTGLSKQVHSRVEQGSYVIVEGRDGKKYRSYSPQVKEVTIAVKGREDSSNDLDLLISECTLPTDPDTPPACEGIANSQGSTDTESATFIPKAGRHYRIRIDGYTIRDKGEFTCTETQTFEAEKGILEFKSTPTSSEFEIYYQFSEETLKNSFIFSHPLFIDGQYHAVGSIQLTSDDESLLQNIPLQIKNNSPTLTPNTLGGKSKYSLLNP